VLHFPQKAVTRTKLVENGLGMADCLSGQQTSLCPSFSVNWKKGKATFSEQQPLRSIQDFSPHSCCIVCESR